MVRIKFAGEFLIDRSLDEIDDALDDDGLFRFVTNLDDNGEMPEMNLSVEVAPSSVEGEES